MITALVVTIIALVLLIAWLVYCLSYIYGIVDKDRQTIADGINSLVVFRFRIDAKLQWIMERMGYNKDSFNLVKGPQSEHIEIEVDNQQKENNDSN